MNRQGFSSMLRSGRVVTLGLAIASAIPGSAVAQSKNTPAAMDAAREGGVVLLCRHAITARMREVEPVDYDDISTQRLLSPEGEEQARSLGHALRTLGVAFSEVVSSPMNRAWRTAEQMFGESFMIDSAWHTNGPDFSGPPMKRRADGLAQPVPDGNRLIVSHIGTMLNALERSPGEVEEGDCVVVRPNGNGHDVIGVVPWRAWLRAAEGRLDDFLESLGPLPDVLRLSGIMAGW